MSELSPTASADAAVVPPASAAAAERRPLPWLYRLNPETWLLGAFLVVLVTLWQVYGNNFTMAKKTIVSPIVAMGVVVLIGAVARREQFLSGDADDRRAFFAFIKTMMRDWAPLILCYIVYENLQMMTRLISPGATYDALLSDIEVRVFGVEPTIWLQKITTPWFTDYMSFCYGLYFFVPTALFALAYVRKGVHSFREQMLAQIFCIYTAFVCFVLVPVLGPRAHLAAVYTDPVLLHGPFIYGTQTAFTDMLQKVKTDCFPSLHTANSTVLLIMAWRFRDLFKYDRIFFWIALPFMVSLWFSTIYLRYHYTPDVLAGWILAGTASWLAIKVEAKWSKVRAEARA